MLDQVRLLDSELLGSQVMTTPEAIGLIGADIVADASAPAAIWDGVRTPITTLTDAWGDNGDYLTLTRGGTNLARNGSPSGDVVITLTNDETTIVNGFLPDDFDPSPDIVRLYQNEIQYLFEASFD